MKHFSPNSAIAGRIRAEQTPAQLVAAIQASFHEFRDGQESRLSSIEAAMDNAAIRAAGDRIGGPGIIGPVDNEYRASFTEFFRTGRGEEAVREANAAGDRGRINAALSEGSGSSGGYLAPVEWDRQIHQRLVVLSPMRQLAQVQVTSVGAYSTVWSSDTWGSGWVGETAARPTTATPVLSSITFAAGEIYANAAATQRILDDGQVDVAQWLAARTDIEFARQEGLAFLSGSGANQPMGLLAYVPGGAADGLHPGGNLTVVPSGAAATIPTTDTIVDFFYSQPAPYRANSTWLMNLTTAAAISKFKSSTGEYIWRDGLMVGQPATLMGRPVAIDENMPSIAAGNIAVAFGDFYAGYLINDRTGTRVLRDPYTAKPYVVVYTWRRVGGGVLDPNAIRLLKISAS